ncbi:MAG: hypothetical protein COZ92_01100 [Candidatus Nealsonbacteria bacterium CG_4_8_14_3_um_filter_40_11]|uniref:Prepilin-type N-terminal cleavage/methylation domain-containing protein n=2 Tax=Candidatus Nealsoniibacteriota TaxID=1817911 RepID=A0A2M7UVM8_9BACT|nr:MAG: hypothetical protein COZ92_01100 [Candidatus Nealsonbacteria bacterium CG_4_8_14_3_um_filter_40_11]PIZ88008.1 MAG: hypothetical protein COX91_02450 [Candidatus Nealsonbacteria bacterium CG_4_10_14_0_2_um_filter_39_15]
MYTSGGKNMKNRGFTLVELLVGMVIFSLVGGIAAGVLLSGLRAQRKTLAYQELLSQTSYLMEYMSRSLRMARKELSAPACLSQNGLNYEVAEIVPGHSGLKFKNYQGICQGFFLQGDQLKEWKEGYAEPLSLTSADLQVSAFNAHLFGESQGTIEEPDNDQSKVTIFFDIKGKEESKIKIQTTVSQRNLDILQ